LGMEVSFKDQPVRIGRLASRGASIDPGPLPSSSMRRR
jgi:hypothetical protein